MNKFTPKIMLFSLVLFALGVGFALKGGMQVNAQTQSFYQEIGKPLKVLIIAKLAPEDIDQFWRAMLLQDSSSIIDHDVYPDTLLDSDAILFILDEWSDTSQLPFQEALGVAYKKNMGVIRNVISREMRVIVDGDKKIMLFFYSRAAVPGTSQTCIMKLFLDAMENPPDRRKIKLENCTD